MNKQRECYDLDSMAWCRLAKKRLNCRLCMRVHMCRGIPLALSDLFGFISCLAQAEALRTLREYLLHATDTGILCSVTSADPGPWRQQMGTILRPFSGRLLASTRVG